MNLVYMRSMKKALVPLGPLGPSFLPLVGLGEVRVLLAGRHLAVFPSSSPKEEPNSGRS